MLLIIQAIIPIVLVSAMGYFLAKRKFVSKDFWQGAEKLAYFVLLPSLFFRLTFVLDLSGENIFIAPLILFLSILVITFLLLLLKSQISRTNPCFTSMFQGSIRFNSYILISIALVLYGPEVTGLIAILVALLVPIINLFCVYILTYFGTANLNITNIAKRIATNPLVLPCVLGVLLNIVGVKMPLPVDQALDIMGKAALPLGLLCVGAAIDLKSLKDVKSELVVASFFKLILFPILTLIFGTAFMLGSAQLSVLILFSSIPAASASYILAKQYGGNASLMANIIMVQTIASIFTIPLMLIIARLVIS